MESRKCKDFPWIYDFWMRIEEYAVVCLLAAKFLLFTNFYHLGQLDDLENSVV